MGLLNRLLHRESAPETSCPRCGVPSPPEDVRVHGLRLGHARGLPRRSERRGPRAGALNAEQYILSLDDGTPQARASERIALRLADALEVAWAPIPVPANHPRAQAQAPATTADRDWVLAVAMPWSGDGERLRRLVEAMPYPLLVVSPAAAKRRMTRPLALSQRRRAARGGIRGPRERAGRADGGDGHGRLARDARPGRVRAPSHRGRRADRHARRWPCPPPHAASAGAGDRAAVDRARGRRPHLAAVRRRLVSAARARSDLTEYGALGGVLSEQ